MRLRADVEVELKEGHAVLHDPVLSRTVRMEAFDGRPLEELSPSTQRTLLLLNLVEGAGAQVVERARNVKRGQARLGRVILGESRFGCVGSGDCCQSYNFGPLSDEDVARLEGLDLAAAFPALLPPYWYERDVSGQKWRFLSAVNNRCVFLLDDCRCGIHAHFGAEQKPNLCRFYPFEQFATLDGVQLYDKGHCSEFSVTSRSGPLVREQLDQLASLLDSSPRLHHPVVLLDEHTPVDFGYLQPLLRRVVGELEQPARPAPEMLRAYARRTHALKQALEECALTPEAPGAAVEALLERGVEPFFAPASPEALLAGADALQLVAQEWANLLTLPVASEHETAIELYSGRQAKELIPTLHLVQEVAAHLCGQPLSDYARRVAAVSVDEADADDVLRLSLRHQLFGHDALVDERVLPAQLRLAMSQLMALWGARVRAVGEGRDRIVAADLDRGHMLTIRMSSWTALQRLLLDENDQASPILEALPELARWQPQSATMAP